MKGLSVLFTLALLVLAHQLSTFLKRVGGVRVPATTQPRLLAQGLEARPNTRTNTRGLGPGQRLLFRLNGKVPAWYGGFEAEPYNSLQF